MIPFYILGLLQRYGPMHGYQIKKKISEQLSDFTQIKLPNIYYHLEKMHSHGLLSGKKEKPGSRPQKTVYLITNKGKNEFHERLNKLLELNYRPTFSSDGLFYFSDSLAPSQINQGLQKYITKLKHIIDYIEKHRYETIAFVPNEMKSMVYIIFNHHLFHYRAELNWTVETLNTLTKGDFNNG